MRFTIFSSIACTLVIATTSIHADSVLVPAGGDIQTAIDSMSDGDTILLEAGTYQPANTLSTNGKAITILGVAGNQGQPLSIIDGQDAIRIFAINNDEGPSTVLENLALINGSAVDGFEPLGAIGGAIYCGASPTIRNCRFTANQSNSGALCIMPDANPVVRDCTFTNNVGLFCAGIYFPIDAGSDPLTPVTIEGCTFSGNTTNFAANGGVISFNDSGKRLSLNSCVFENNIGDTAVYATNDLVINGCTFNDSSTTMISWSGGTVVVRDSELTGSSSQRGLVTTTLGPGGDFVQIEGSTFRGFGGHAVGMEESQADGVIINSNFRDNRLGITAVALPTNRSWTITGCNFTGNITAPNTSGGAVSGGNMSFTNCGFADNFAEAGSAVYGSNLTFTNCLLNENSVGDGAGIINATGQLVMDSCDISNNASSGPGGGVLLSGTVDSTSTISNCTFFRNFAPSGAGMACFNATAIFNECDFNRNEASLSEESPKGTGGGGVLCQSDTNATFTNCTFIENKSNYAGGGVISNESQTSFEDCVFDSNTSDFGGGLVAYLQSTLTIVDSTFSANLADKTLGNGSGGAFYLSGSTAGLTNVTFEDNLAYEGAAMGIFGPCDASFNNCNFSRNESTTIAGAGWGGGMIGFPPGTMVFVDCVFNQNIASGSDGGALLLKDFDTTLSSCIFSDNTSGDDGGALWSKGNTTLLDCSLTGNTADDDGGGIYFESDINNGVAQVIGSNILGNNSFSGGGIFIDLGAIVQLQSTRVCGNTVDQVTGDPYTDLGGNIINDDEDCGCPLGDVDCNLIVDGSDLAIVLGNWGPCTSANCIADLDNNGSVNGADLSLVLGNWGSYDG